MTDSSGIDPGALDDLILGRGVKRGRHAVPGPVQPIFKERLAALGFRPVRVGEVTIEVGERVPAWLLGDGTADFGTVFWEVFTDTARRKLWGSEVRNGKGDWAIQLPPSSKETIWAAPQMVERYDASRPVGMF